MSASPTGNRPVRVFLAGASGAIGHVLVPRLVAAGYAVAAMTRSPEKSHLLAAAGAEPVVCDVFDQDGLRSAVLGSQPDVVINQLTDLPKSGLNPRKLGRYYEGNNRVRREGTRNLLAAAREAGARRFISQSIAFWYDPQGEHVKDEDAKLWVDGPEPIGEAVRALEDTEHLVMDASSVDGVVLRYGTFYGPGTWYSRSGQIGQQMRARQYPIIGAGEGITSFIHLGDAADACVAFVESGRAGVYNVVDDEPAAASAWMPQFAKAVGAKPPLRLPAGLARLVAGKGLVEWSTRAPGASNAKLKRELGWRPRYPSWRDGFTSGLEEA